MIGIEITSSMSVIDEKELNLSIKDLLDDVADFAETSLKAHVPFYSGRMHDAIERDRVQRIVHQGDIAYKVNIGIGAIPPTQGESPESKRLQYPIFVLRGTGEFGPTGLPIRSGGNLAGNVKDIFESLEVSNLIQGPKQASHGNVMAFEEGGETVFTRRVKGQKPNDFLDRAIDETNEYIERKKLPFKLRVAAVT